MSMKKKMKDTIKKSNKGKLSRRQKVRTAIQLCWAAITNGYLIGFLEGKIYQGPIKNVCLPGLNCYSCPGSLGSCPIGALQATLGDRNYKFAFYVIGTLMIFGAFFGRIVCGFLCPFGLIQDLLYMIPVPRSWRKRKLIPGDRVLKYLKYVMLVLLCIVLPMTVLDVIGDGKPWFCAYVCPAGTFMGGVPLIATNPLLRDALGWLWAWKLSILIGIFVLSLLFYRPFCRYLCPLGAIYGCFNPIAIQRYKKVEAKCIDCGKCKVACPFDIDPSKNPNSVDCIRCGRCLDSCPTSAIESTGLLEKIKRKS